MTGEGDPKMKEGDTDDKNGGEKDLKEEARDAAGGAETFVATELEKGLTSDQVLASREKWGVNEIPVPETPLYMIFLRQFYGFLPMLIELAAIIALAVEDFVDFAIIASILLVNAMLGFREEYHAKLALDEISNKLESEIAVRRDGAMNNVTTKELVPGDIVLLVGGTIVPADIKWMRGDRMQIDTAALTGEPIPRKYPSPDYGDVILSGTTVVQGECYGQVINTGVNTEIGRAQADVLSDKAVRVVSVFQTKIMYVVQILVTSCFAIVLAVLFVQGFAYNGFMIKVDIKKTILDALSILIASIPIALPLVLQVNLALGAAFMAREHHSIVTSIPALQDIASMSMLCSDKTGTLTTANMSIIPEQVYNAPGFHTDDILLYAYLCSNADKKDDPIDKAIVRAFLESSYADRKNEYTQVEIIGFNPIVKRVVSMVQKADGSWLTIAKGLPAKILDTSAGSVDDHEFQWKCAQISDKKWMAECKETDNSLSKAGYKTIGIAVCEGNARDMENPVWKFAGLLPMLDPPRADTKATINSLHHANISVKMITGDHVNVGKETARLIGLGTDIRSGDEVRNATEELKRQLIWEADGFASVLPSDKREAVLTLRNHFGLVVGMTGDGVNDAPALSAAQVGIAVEGATDAARNAADLVLTKSGLSPIYGAVLESRRIFSRIKAYVVYRVGASIVLVLTLSIIIFISACAVDSLYIIILALLNDISMIPVAYDHAAATTKPQLPKAQKLVIQSIFYGFFLSIFSLVFILSFNYTNSLPNEISINTCSNETQGFIWFHLVLVTELSIFSVRAPSHWFLSMPSPYLVASILVTCIGSACIAVFALGLHADNMGIIIAYNFGLFAVADVLKLWFRKLINEMPGEVIEGDELIQPDESESESSRHLRKAERYQVHKQAYLNPSELEHTVQVVQEGFVAKIFSSQSAMETGFVSRRKRTTSLQANAGLNSPFFTGDVSHRTVSMPPRVAQSSPFFNG